MFYGTFPAISPDTTTTGISSSTDSNSSSTDQSDDSDSDSDKAKMKSHGVDHRPRTSMKLVTLLPDEKVIGIHLIGMTHKTTA